jgi:hypothetical protein
MRHRSLSELVARGPLISLHPNSFGLASAEMPRNRLSKGNDLIEGAMIKSQARDRPAETLEAVGRKSAAHSACAPAHRDALGSSFQILGGMRCAFPPYELRGASAL